MPQSPEAVREFFRAHWTVRKYKPIPLPPAHLDVLLYAAQRAPTDATAQMYSLIRLVTPEVRERVAQLSGNAHIATAAEAFIICGDLHRLDRILATRQEKLSDAREIHLHFAIGDAVMAGQNLLLAAEMLGYRGCWIGGILNQLDALSTLLALPRHVFPFAGLTIGIPDEAPQHRPRVHRDHIVHVDRYQDPSDDELQKSIQQMGPITGRGDWAQTLSRYFAPGGTMEIRNRALLEYLNKQFAKGEGEEADQ